MSALTAEQAAQLDAAGHVVHGVDAQGAYLGLVPREQAAAVASGAPPAAGSWRWYADSWVRELTLADAKDQAWQAVKEERSLRLRGTFTHAGLAFDIDPINITGAVLAAMVAKDAQQPYSQVWVLADNSTTTLDAEGMIAVGLACAAAVDALWQTSVALRMQIEAAQTVEEARAVTWS